jgi:hypothetical protein
MSALGAFASLLFAQPDPILPKSGEIPPRLPAPSDTVVRDTAVLVTDSGRVVLDSGRILHDSSATAKDSLLRERDFDWESPVPDVEECRTGVEGPVECWRSEPDLANQDIGYAGARAWSLSLTNWRPLPMQSPYFPFWKDSPYLAGGTEPPEQYALQRIGGDLIGLEEPWRPVVPLDTPVTRLDWMRGALNMNVFDIRLDRMFADRLYMGLDFYSATSDSQTYDYQFNVHQPYLGGWGFLGQIYKPIDRDSASLVLGGVSHSIHANQVRPRLGYWFDTSRVAEVFFDRIENHTTLTFPNGPNRQPGALIPTGPDSIQALMPSSLTALTEGVIYGERHEAWSGQAELSHGAFDLSEVRPVGGNAFNEDRIQADLFRFHGMASAPGLIAKPSLTVDAGTSFWHGDPQLGAVPGVSEDGWMDDESAELEVRPDWAHAELRGLAGLGRSSRMDDQVYWLPRYGASARVFGMLGFGAEASLSSRMEDPTWEMLYRTNPARFRFANPDLKPRTDRTYRAAASWNWRRLSLEGGIDRLSAEDAWLPGVLPAPDACADLSAGGYEPLAGRTCDTPTSPSPPAGVLTDSLALRLRNYDREIVDAWHLGLGFGLGNWKLDLQNRFVLSRDVDDPDLKATLRDLSIPERVFKGRLGWKRNLLDDKLKLDFAWDWEWFSARYAWVPDLAGKSRILKLDEYLALDFGAAMKIKTFTLFFKAKNFNHDRYATEPGVHPPGLNFRFGVDWTLFN